MTYAVASALQTAVYQTLAADTDITALVGSDIYDDLPPGTPPDTYISLGPETAQEASDISGDGAKHEFTISVVTDNGGFQTVKDIGGAVCDALINAELILARGYLVGLWFKQAKAARSDNATSRRVDLTFQAQVQDS